MLAAIPALDSLRSLLIVGLLVGCVALAASVAEDTKDGKSVDKADQIKVNSTKPTAAGSAKKSRHGNPTASDRLMRELQRVHKSENYKKGLYTVDLVNESLYEWRVKITPAMFDADSELYKDLVKLNEQGKEGHVELSFEFKDTFPFSPPFVRIVYPILLTDKGGGLFGGAICMDIFTPQGWSSAYKIEATILQVIQRLLELEVRVKGSDPAEVAAANSPEAARKGFEKVLDMHREWKSKSDA